MNIQTIEINQTPYVLMPKSDYEALLTSYEDVADIAAADAARARIAAGEETYPAEVIDRLYLHGESPIKVLREWRKFSAAALAGYAGISAAYLSDIERGKKDGSVRVIKNIARILQVDMDMLVSG